MLTRFCSCCHRRCCFGYYAVCLLTLTARWLLLLLLMHFTHMQDHTLANALRFFLNKK